MPPRACSPERTLRCTPTRHRSTGTPAGTRPPWQADKGADPQLRGGPRDTDRTRSRASPTCCQHDSRSVRRPPVGRAMSCGNAGWPARTAWRRYGPRRRQTVISNGTARRFPAADIASHRQPGRLDCGGHDRRRSPVGAQDHARAGQPSAAGSGLGGATSRAPGPSRTAHLPATIRAEAAQQQALGHAMVGELDLVKRKLDQAQQLLIDSAPAGDVRAAEPTAHYERSLFAMQRAICYHEAGQPAKAVDIYRETLSPTAATEPAITRVRPRTLTPPSGLSTVDVFTRRLRLLRRPMAVAVAAVAQPDEAATRGMEALQVMPSQSRWTHSGHRR
jgi:hypothetical protein